MSGNKTVYEATSGKADFLKDGERRYKVVESNQPLVVYHAQCADGFTAAWACWERNPEWEYRAMAYGDKAAVDTLLRQLKENFGTRDVYFLDFCLSRDEMWHIAAASKKLVILDHHKSAAEALNGFQDEVNRCYDAPRVEVIFDMERSGAGIAWDYFWPGKERPALVDVVEDRDLWRFRFDHTKELMAFIFSHDYDFETWNYLASVIRHFYDDKVMIGRVLIRKRDKDIRELLKSGRRAMTIGGVEVPVCNVPHMMASEAGLLLAEEGYPFAATYVDTATARRFSLRSLKGGADVRVIAEKYGGGGHPNAAGFGMPLGWEGDA